MDQFADYARQLTELVHHHIPAQAIPPAVPTAVVALVFGVGICVLGAKLARWFITVFFAVGGLMAGLKISQCYGYPPPLTALIGGAAVGTVGYVLHRLWVGIFTATFLATVAFSVLSTQVVFPHLVEFDKTEREVVVDEFHPGPEAAAQASWEHFDDYLERFGEYLIEREPLVKRHAALCVLGAGLLGLLMGIFLCRLTLILFSAALGMSLIGSGIAVLGSCLGMEVYQTCQQRPEMSAIALASFFLVSVVLQAALTRPEPAGPPAPKRAS